MGGGKRGTAKVGRREREGELNDKFSNKGSRQGSLERIIDSSPLSKAERKKLEKYNKFNIDLQALLAAVEHKQLDRARGILETTNVDINRSFFRSCLPSLQYFLPSIP
ncbi:uncharacterized protein CEXT_363921 [Caerostris extrusa]|uniref:Uncharacterized protein n=1 Tax=Caerostris extrusa TaxID=172846 RepID=A0AAV4NWA6_CAEEX|nr:uncharacterized protein CEXT_363921 [Caerostris extrusa]